MIGLAETRMTGTGELTTDDGHTFYYSRQDKHFEGVGFLVRKYLTDSVSNYSLAKPIIITIIQVYAPITNYSDNKIEDFYETIEK